MKAVLFWLVTLVIFFLIFIPVSSLASRQQRFALVIGNGAYLSGSLKNPVSDANDLAFALKGSGFSVALKTNADRRTMKEAIREFGRRLRSGGVGLFYYAGHGLQVKGRNYLVPIDAQIETESEVEYETVDAGRVLGQMEDAGNGLNIVILDACRNNPFGRSFRSAQRGLAVIDAPEGTILAYATAPGKIASDGDGRNGLYTAKLLKHMRTPGLPIELFFKQVRRDVRRASGKQQIPWTESSLIGDFYFYPKSGSGSKTDGKRIETTEGGPISKQAPAQASVDQEVVGSKVPERNSRYRQYASCVVLDTKTGLEWYAGPDRATSLNAAKSWVANLDVAGGGWRMPSTEELQSLYQKGVGTRNMTPLLKTTGWFVWSDYKAMPQTWGRGFLFRQGGWIYAVTTASHNDRGFAVRGRR